MREDKTGMSPSLQTIKRFLIKPFGPLLHTLNEWVYHYRFDIFAMMIMIVFTLYYVEVLLRPGQVVFSDIDFPFNASTYLDEVFGIWNTKWNTTSMLNVPRLLILLPSYLISMIGQHNGNLFLKSFIIQNLVLSGISFYLLCKRLVSVYINSEFNMIRIFLVIYGGLYYALNPWVIFRIQHIYLLVGYGLFPLILLYFFKVFDHKFQQAAITNYNPFEKKLYKSNVRDIILLAYVITIASAAIHYFFYTVFLLAPLLFLLSFKYFVKYRHEDKSLKRDMWQNMFKKSLLLATLILGFSFYWLFIYLGGIVFDVQASQNNINVIDTYVAFSRHSSIKEVLYFTSYWWPMIDMRQLPISFYIGGGIMLATGFIGLMYYFTKHHIILFMGLLATGLVVLSTGVYYPEFAKLFITIAELPVIGTIFRDPNKLVALLAMFIGVFIVFGLEFIFNWVYKLKSYRYMVTYSLVGLFALSLVLYLLPMKTLYFDHFYAPIEEPTSYLDLKEFYKDDKAHYVVYLPLADEMVQPYAHVATPYWNVNRFSSQSVAKATGDVHIYNAPIPTLFQFEGNDPAIAYYFNYLQYLLDYGRSNNISESIEAFGTDQLIYHDEYNEQFYRQDFNKAVLSMDQSLTPVFENDIFTVFDLDNTLRERDNENSLVSGIIQTPYGLERTSIYEKIGLYDPLKLPIVYMNQEKSDVSSVEEIYFNYPGIDGLIEAKSEKDILLSQLPELYYLYPFNWTNQGNVFLGWSKTFLSSVDWSWYLDSQNMINRSFEFDRGEGVAVTFASNRLDVEPYLRDNIKGKLIMDFNTMLRTENLFVPDNPDLFELSSNPYSEIEEFQTLHGELIKGDPKDIWQVAKSGLLEAKGGTPYYYELLLSGRDVDKLHLKVRFYDDNNQEIGVSYIVASDEESYFDTIKFVGEVVSPSATKYMRIDLLTFQNPEYKSYWWIHDINIYDLSQYVEENTLFGQYDALTSETYDVYVRTFNSEKGGLLNINVGENSFELNTIDEIKNTFAWHYLGEVELSQGNHPVELTAKDGFNAVNSIAIVPRSLYLKAKEQIKTAMGETGVIMTFEPSIELDYKGNIQSDRVYPSLSLGKAIALEEGIISGELDILVEDIYTFYPNIHYTDEERGFGRLVLYKDSKVLKSWTLSNREVIEDREQIVEYTSHSSSYPYSFIDLLTPYTYEDRRGYSASLDPGHYKFEVILDAQVDNKSGVDKIKPFDTSTIVFPIEDTQFNEVGSCDRISWDMMSEEVVGNQVTISFDPTCSLDWYSYGSNKIEVQVNEEFLIRFDARSFLLKNRHIKVLFLDDDNHFIDVTYISEVEEIYKSDWNHYEQLVKVPEGATNMMVQFLGNGDRHETSTLEIVGFEVYNYNTFIALDHMYVENDLANSYRVRDIQGSDMVVNRALDQLGLSYEGLFHETNALLNTFISPNANWRLDGNQSAYALNGITQGFYIGNMEEVTLRLLLMPGYILGLFIHLVTLMATIIWIVRRRSCE